MKNIPKLIYNSYLKFYHSIAFYPLIITASLFFFAILMSYYETAYNVRWIEEYSFLWVKGNDNARDILSTIIMGIISLMVFSFSMVMIVLNQAATNFSPRVIPGLITKRAHQVVLGFYLGTIIYGLILLHNIKPVASGYDLPQLGIFLGELLGIICLSLFVYFIHSISTSIQIHEIINKVYRDTLKQINIRKEKKEDHKHHSVPSSEEWETINSLESGYYRDLEVKKIAGFAQKHDIMIEVLIPKGTFIISGYPLLKVSGSLKDKKLYKAVLDYFIFHSNEYIIENYIYGLKQISEVAVKALSPGINDPGSAIKAIEHLTLLFKEIFELPERELFFDEDYKLRIIQNDVPLNKLLYTMYSSIREYGKHNIFVILKLLESMKFLLVSDNYGKLTTGISDHIKTILEDADHNIKNSDDRELINDQLKELNTLADIELNNLDVRNY